MAAGTIPTNDGDTCIFASVPAAQFASMPAAELTEMYRQTIRSLDPELDAALAALDGTVRLRAFAGMPGFIRQSAGRGWALVGDAGFFRDPLTAHGITDALRDAEFLARAIISGRPRALQHYEPQRNDCVQDMLTITDAICSFDWSLDELSELHLDLSRAMSSAVESIRHLQPAGAAV
jgi:2-polyprenyl-6-methoxyphenol hydroxylase-like FAD-dependent oxidoreductase